MAKKVKIIIKDKYPSPNNNKNKNEYQGKSGKCLLSFKDNTLKGLMGSGNILKKEVEGYIINTVIEGEKFKFFCHQREDKVWACSDINTGYTIGKPSGRNYLTKHGAIEETIRIINQYGLEEILDKIKRIKNKQ
jgi:hypothetical protein